MPNTLVGLSYSPQRNNIETEKQFINFLSDLKTTYNSISSQFKINSFNRQIINNFKQFLETANHYDSYVILTGSGDICGLSVKDATLQYDLSLVNNLIEEYKLRTGGSCFGCKNLRVERICYDESEWRCSEHIAPMIWEKCEKCSSPIMGVNDKPPKKLAEILYEITK